MSRRKGFSLVELLIVLAVIAALIATITPVALNAIKKAKATQVAQNLKTLASALENAAYVNGVEDGFVNDIADLKDLGRDIDGKVYNVYYEEYSATKGEFRVWVVTKADVNKDEVDKIINTLPSGSSKTNWSDIKNTVPQTKLTNNTWTPADTDSVMYYEFDFTVY